MAKQTSFIGSPQCTGIGPGIGIGVGMCVNMGGPLRSIRSFVTDVQRFAAMPKIIFRDFDDFAAAINGIAGQFVPTARSEKDWWVQPAPVERVSMQLVQIGGAATFAGDGTAGAITLGIPVQQTAKIRIDGNALQQSSFLLVKEGQAFTFASGHATLWAGIGIPLDHPLLAPDLLQSLYTRVFSGSGSTHALTKAPYITNIQVLLSRLFAEDGTVSFLDAASARAAEEEIMTVTSRALESSSRIEHSHHGRPRLSRELVISRALLLIEASAGQPLLVRDLCRAAQVSERTLRNVFQEYFSVGPMRLLKVRQLREIRTALLNADPAHETVASIASRFGVWDFSLFARNYREIYEEAPSHTLRFSFPQRPGDRTLSKTWIRYASRKFSGYLAA
jgi:AraC family ethanolamine operon transcriptional activator